MAKTPYIVPPDVQLARIKAREQRAAAIHPAANEALLRFRAMGAAERSAMIDKAIAAALEATTNELELLYQPGPDPKARADHFINNGPSATILKLSEMKHTQKDEDLRFLLYKLIQAASGRVDIKALKPHVLANMRATYLQVPLQFTRDADAITPEAVAELGASVLQSPTQMQNAWDNEYAKKRGTGDIALLDADELLVRHLRKKGAQAAAAVLGISHRAQSTGAEQARE